MFYQVKSERVPFVVSMAQSKPDDPVVGTLCLELDIRQKWWDVKPGDKVLDIGAGCGSYTLPALAQGAEMVVSVEPDRDSYFDLCSNVAANRFLGRFIPIPFMAGDEVKICSSYYHNTRSQRPEGGAESRLMITVDTLVRDYLSFGINWIKVDVEGSELDVLKGAVWTLTAFRPTMIVENHLAFVPGVDVQIREFLSGLNLGYKEEQSIGPGGGNENWSLWTAEKT